MLKILFLIIEGYKPISLAKWITFFSPLLDSMPPLGLRKDIAHSTSELVTFLRKKLNEMVEFWKSKGVLLDAKLLK